MERQNRVWMKGASQGGASIYLKVSYRFAVRSLAYPIATVLLLSSFIAAQEVVEFETVADGNAKVIQLYNEGKFGAGIRLAEQVERYARENLREDDPDRLASVSGLGILYWADGRLSDAETILTSSLETRRRLRLDDPALAGLTNNVALLLGSLGQNEEAERRFLEALELSNDAFELPHRTNLSIRNNLSTLYIAEERLGEAEAFLTPTLQERKELLGPTHHETLSSINNLLALYESQERYELAEMLFEDALPTITDTLGPNHRETLGFRSNMARVYRAQGQFEKSEALYIEILEVLPGVAGENHHQTLSTRSNFATLLQSMGKFDQAEELLDAVLETRTKKLGSRHPSTLLSMNNLGYLYVEQGRLDEAAHVFEETLILRQEVLGMRHYQTLLSVNNMTELAIRQEDFARAALEHSATLDAVQNTAIREMREAQSRETRAAGRSISKYSWDLVGTAALAAQNASAEDMKAVADWASNAIVTLKGLGGAYEAALNNAANSLPTSEVAIVNELRANIAALELVAARGEGEEFKALLSEIDRLEATISSKVPSFTQNLVPVTARDVADTLKIGQVLVEFAIINPLPDIAHNSSGPQIIGVMMEVNADPKLFHLGSVSDIQASLETLTNPRERVADLPRARIKVYQTLFRPMGAPLRDATEVLIVPDGILTRVPFGGLRPARDIDFWIEEQVVRILPTSRVLTDRFRSEVGKTAILFGAPDYGTASVDKACLGTIPNHNARIDNNVGLLSLKSSANVQAFCPLPGTAEEVAELHDLFRKLGQDVLDPLVGTNATEKAFREMRRSPRILHLATHGTAADRSFAYDPHFRTMLAFAGANTDIADPLNDGILRGSDIVRQPLRGVELVTLSACDTSHGDISQAEGAMSLANAFRLAGAQNVMMTYWAVDDAKTKSFMVDFYGFWLSGRANTPAAALRATQLMWISRGEHLIHWAAFALSEN